MNKICTSLEQSKKLMELGINVDTADMRYSYIAPYNPSSRDDMVYTIDFAKPLDIDIPAWSLAVLMDLLPSQFTEVGKYVTATYEIKICKYKLTSDVNLYQIAYGNYKWYEDGNYSWKDMINTGEKEDLLDAAFEMICWLKENGKI